MPQLSSERRAFVAKGRAGSVASRFAIAAVIASALLFLAALPFVSRPFPAIAAFIPAYESALVICDLITAVLLFGHFRFRQSGGVFILATGYLFTAFLALVHALSFPGSFAATGLIGGGSQTTVLLYMFWHGGFPLFVIAYALTGRTPVERTRPGLSPNAMRARANSAIVAGVVAVLIATIVLTLAATSRSDILPELIVNGRFTPALSIGLAAAMALSVVALLFLWRRRPHTVLDVWLVVVMWVWVFDVALAAVFNSARFDLGWYLGRGYGLFAASFLLIVLLVENGTHYARLVQVSIELGAANRALELMSLHDALTGLPNRRFFDGYLADQAAIARRNGRSLALIICDIDAFKSFNDRYGHPAGDVCLQKVAAALTACCRRPADRAIRHGGEEFALILPDINLAGAMRVGEAVREAVAALNIADADSSGARILTLSGGIAVIEPSLSHSVDELIAAADMALYRAKSLGRNRMVCAEPVAANPSTPLERVPQATA